MTFRLALCGLALAVLASCAKGEYAGPESWQVCQDGYFQKMYPGADDAYVCERVVG